MAPWLIRTRGPGPQWWMEKFAVLRHAESIVDDHHKTRMEKEIKKRKSPAKRRR